MVHVLGSLKQIKIWFTIYYDNLNNRWKASIRSAHLPINQIAQKYHGGGHKLAAGATFTNKNEIKTFINEIKQYLMNNKE